MGAGSVHPESALFGSVGPARRRPGVLGFPGAGGAESGEGLRPVPEFGVRASGGPREPGSLRHRQGNGPRRGGAGQADARLADGRFKPFLKRMFRNLGEKISNVEALESHRGRILEPMDRCRMHVVPSVPRLTKGAKAGRISSNVVAELRCFSGCLWEPFPGIGFQNHPSVPPLATNGRSTALQMRTIGRAESSFCVKCATKSFSSARGERFQRCCRATRSPPRRAFWTNSLFSPYFDQGPKGIS